MLGIAGHRLDAQQPFIIRDVPTPNSRARKSHGMSPSHSPAQVSTTQLGTLHSCEWRGSIDGIPAFTASSRESSADEKMASIFAPAYSDSDVKTATSVAAANGTTMRGGTLCRALRRAGAPF